MDKSYPEPVVGAFILNSKRELLLVKSNKWNKKLWTVPGGHIELGESIENAVIREVREEVGLIVKYKKTFNILEAIYPKNFIKHKHFIFIECICFVTNGNAVKIDQKEIQVSKWFKLDKIPMRDLEEYTKLAVIDFLKEKSY